MNNKVLEIKNILKKYYTNERFLFDEVDNELHIMGLEVGKMKIDFKDKRMNYNIHYNFECACEISTIIEKN